MQWACVGFNKFEAQKAIGFEADGFLCTYYYFARL